MKIWRLLYKLLGEEWQPHFDYCGAVLRDDTDYAIGLSGKPCTERCASRPGPKVLLGRRTGRVWYP